MPLSVAVGGPGSNYSPHSRPGVREKHVSSNALPLGTCIQTQTHLLKAGQPSKQCLTGDSVFRT